MSTNNRLSIGALIDENQLATAQKMMGGLIHLTVVTIDTEGVLHGDQGDSNLSCPLSSIKSPQGSDCMKSKAILNKHIAGNPYSQISECKCGIMNCISPVIVENVYLGAVIIGHFIVDNGSGDSAHLRSEHISRYLNLPPGEVENVVNEIPVISESCLMQILEYGSFMAGYFSDIAAKKIMEQKLLIETQEKLRHAKESSHAQLKTLSAQINPHFLFNTLNSITRMAYLEDAENTKEMTYCLSDLLRYNLKQTEEFPTIGSEIENIRRYLYIQDIRYNDRIRHHIDIPSQIHDCRIPSMLLQPIVENALIHGLEPKVEGGSISITAEVSENSIRILIKDTGVGINARKLKDFLAHGSTSNPGLGIKNSHQRLQRYFGSEYGIQITSREHFETVVEIKFPYFKELAPLQTH